MQEYGFEVGGILTATEVGISAQQVIGKNRSRKISEQ